MDRRAIRDHVHGQRLPAPNGPSATSPVSPSQVATARRAMIKLGMHKTDKEFRPLLATDLRPYDTTALEDVLKLSRPSDKQQKGEERAEQRAVLGDHHVSWIWENWAFMQSGNLTEKVKLYFQQCKSPIMDTVSCC